MMEKIIIILLLILMLLLMGSSFSDNLDEKITTHDIYTIIPYNNEFRKPGYKKLERKLSDFCDDEKELTYIMNGIMDFIEKLKNHNIEYLSAMDMDYTLVCDHYSINERNNVNLCPEGKEISKKSGLLFVIHNHPSNIPLPSENDIMSFAIYNVKYNIIFTRHNSIFILKNVDADNYDCIMGWNDTFQNIKKRLIPNTIMNYINYIQEEQFPVMNL